MMTSLVREPDQRAAYTGLQVRWPEGTACHLKERRQRPEEKDGLQAASTQRAWPAGLLSRAEARRQRPAEAAGSDVAARGLKKNGSAGVMRSGLQGEGDSGQQSH